MHSASNSGVLCVIWLLTIAAVPSCSAPQRRFNLADDIELTQFGDPYTAAVHPIAFSPHHQYFVVTTERGLAEQNRVESSLRVFRTTAVREFLRRATPGSPPPPIWTITRFSRNGPVISHVRWLPTDVAVAFLSRNDLGNEQIFIADLKSRKVDALSPSDRNVLGFDVRDRKHFVYAVRSSGTEGDPRPPVAYAGTGRTFASLVFPKLLSKTYDRGELWAAINERRFRVKELLSGRPVYVYSEGEKALSLSPNGCEVISALPVNDVPADWEREYPPPGASIASRIKVGKQSTNSPAGYAYVNEYALINLCNGHIRSLTGAPTGTSSGWWGGAERPDWSAKGRFVVLPNSFIRDNARGPDEKRPCVALIEVATKSVSCLERWKGLTSDGRYEDGYHYIDDVRFMIGSEVNIIVSYNANGSRGAVEYVRHTDGSWGRDSRDSSAEKQSIDVVVKEGLNTPPALAATDLKTRASRVIWDPNPKLRKINFGDASTYSWKDKHERRWVGVLFKPPDYVLGSRYPLVIQTHGLFGEHFLPSGTFPTAFAARELEASGVMVLQVIDCPYTNTPTEASCNVSGYESAIEQLVSDGLADKNYIGLIGFSRTCYYVLDALTKSALRFRAASITDGVNEGYLQYIFEVDSLNNGLAHETDAIIGAPPFGEGLQEWLRNSPEFNLDKVRTPLQIVALGPMSLAEMWEPYSALRYLSKPVDLIVLPKGTHILTNPAERISSQGGTVDWFRFWLQGYEDPNPAKASQYARWRFMRDNPGK